MGNLRNLAAEATDARASLMSEIISNIKTIKIYCWERHFQKRIKRARRYLPIISLILLCKNMSPTYRKELNVTRLRYKHKVMVKMMEEVGYKLMYLTMIVPFLASGNALVGGGVFFVMSASVLVRMNMGERFPLAVYWAYEVAISMKRIQVCSHAHMFQYPPSLMASSQDFLCMEEAPRTIPSHKPNTGLKVKGLSAVKGGPSKSFSLGNFSFDIKNGDLCILIGKVGSGKVQHAWFWHLCQDSLLLKLWIFYVPTFRAL